MPDGRARSAHYGRAMSRLPAPALRATRKWAQDPNLQVDALFAALVAVLTVVEASSADADLGGQEADLFAYATILIGAASLLFRRRFPLTVLVIVSTVLALFYARDGSDFLAILGVSPFYAVGAHSSKRPQAFVATMVVGAALMVVASVSILDTPTGYDTAGAISMASFLTTATVVGVLVRNRQRIFAATEQRAELAEADRDAEAERAVARERSRIAREMHDVVAHGMSVIAVQAAAAQEIVHTNPDKAAEVLNRIENVGRESLTEMRRMLGVLRDSDDDAAAASLAPQPSLDDVNAAVARSADAGVATDLIITGQERELPPGIELAAFRIVQEALTNVLKHAGPMASASVTINYGPDALTVEIVDDGRGSVSSLSDVGGGNGLIGMRERVEIYGGELAAGPRTGGGYRIRAALPTDDTATRPSVSSTSPSIQESPS